MRQQKDAIPEIQPDAHQIKTLLTEKANHYEKLASSLMMSDDASVMGGGDSVSALSFGSRCPFSTGSRTVAVPPAATPRFIARAGSDRSVLTSVTPDVERSTSQAHTKLARALDFDEQGDVKGAVGAYMHAAELFLKAIHSCKQQQALEPADKLKRILQQTLDRVEELKSPPGSSSRSAPQEQTRSAATSLTKEEIDILKQSSLLASGLFLPWSDKEALALDKEYAKSSSSLFTDPDGKIALSDKQKTRFHSWARPNEILRIRRQNAVLSSIVKPTSGRRPVMVKAITPYTIQQKYVTDCSFVASLCICATFERRFRKRLITSIIHPQDASGNPVYNPAGKYMVKLWLNGVARCVVVDDFLPIDRQGNLLCSQTSSSNGDSLELWVSIIEKAYMKLCGGYDFPGSNSGVDLFSLTGWIPERIHFAKDPNNIKDYETHHERAWERILSASSYGDCLITVSTQSDLDDGTAEEVGLVKGHAYAVLAVSQTRNGTRLLQLKNPWAHKSWKGRYSSNDRQGWSNPSFCQEVGYDPNLASKNDDGVFFICWDDIMKYFKNFHLSWNPDLFEHRLSVHGRWLSDSGPEDDTFNVGENPQYTLVLSDKAIANQATIWILISRHVTRQEQTGSDVSSFRSIVVWCLSPSCRPQATDYLTIHIHRNQSRERIWYPGASGDCVLTGCYTNNPHVLVRYDVEDSSDKNLSLVLSQYQKSNDLNFTLSCFCTEDFALGKPENDLGNTVNLEGAWSTRSAGGPIGSRNYFNNPQYAIKVPSPTTMQVSLGTTTTNAANIVLIPVRQFKDPAEEAVGDAIIDSGKYRHAFVVSEKKKVPAGNYSLILSNFHADQTGIFTVKVSSNSSKLKIEKIVK